MGFFPEYTKRIAPPSSSYTLSTAYQQIRMTIPRIKHLESLEVRLGIEMDIGTADNVSFTKLMDGLANVVKRITFQAGGHNYVNNVSGAGLLRYAANIDVLDDVTVQAIAQGTTADTAGVQYDPIRGPQAALLMERAISTAVTIPLYFGHPQLLEPTNAALYVPMPLFDQDATLDIELGKLAEIGTLGTGVASMIVSPMVIMNMRACPLSTPYYLHELNEYEENYTATGTKEFKVNSLGSYTGILAAYFNNSLVETDPCASGGTIQLALGSTTVLEGTPKEFMAKNGRSKASCRGLFETASPYLDFLTQGMGQCIGVNSVLNANPSNIGGQRFSLLTTIDTLSTSVYARYLTHRIYGDLTKLRVSV